MDIIEAIEKRISCRAFTDQLPDDDTVRKLEQEIAAINDESGLHFQLYRPREIGRYCMNAIIRDNQKPAEAG